jgi:hypothetical protein
MGSSRAVALAPGLVLPTRRPPGGQNGREPDPRPAPDGAITRAG